VTAPTWLGGTRVELATCASTNDEAARLAAGGAPHGTIVVAAAQTAGRGRQGRVWASPPGAGLYLSCVLRPDLAARDVPPLTLAVGIGACDAARAFGAPCALKWPNDLVVPGPGGLAKLGGILTETATAGGKPGAVIVGLGVNLGGELPAELAPIATTIAAAAGGAAPDRAAFLERLLAELEPWIDRYVAGGVAAIAPAWEARAERTARVRATVAGAAVVGRVAGLDADGALRLVDDAGRVHRVVSGEVAEVRGEGDGDGAETSEITPGRVP